MLSFNPDKKSCTGCAACYSVCPVKCISMRQDEEGFIYPFASDSCIGCHLCEKVCPIVNETERTVFEKRAYAGVSKSYNIWKRSASGGAFSEICRAWGDSSTLVSGAAWNGLKVHHICVIGVESIAPLCGSKYVSSGIEDTFLEVRKHLEGGNGAVFCGTPCQVAGLRSFLRKDYPNLLTIDLICHGVGSPSVFEACMKAIGVQWGKGVESYTFRAKRRAHEEDYLTLITNCKSEQYITNDQYLQLFLSQNCLRPSCGENCRFRSRFARPGDITIADFKGLTQIYPDLVGYKRNFSTVIVNSAKGAEVMPRLSSYMDLRECKIDDVIRFNPLFDHHTWFSKDRDRFFADFIENEDSAIAKWTKPYSVAKRSWRRIIYDLLPVYVRRIINDIIHR